MLRDRGILIYEGGGPFGAGEISPTEYGGGWRSEYGGAVLLLLGKAGSPSCAVNPERGVLVVGSDSDSDSEVRWVSEDEKLESAEMTQPITVNPTPIPINGIPTGALITTAIAAPAAAVISPTPVKIVSGFVRQLVNRLNNAPNLDLVGFSVGCWGAA